MKKGEIKRKLLLEEAENLFFTRGYFATGVQDLVQAFHCTKGSFYHHFDSKLQILSEVCALRTEKAYSQFRRTNYTRNIDKLNGLFYCAMPFRSREREMLSLILQLAGTAEADAVIQAVLRAQRAVFLPQLEELLLQMREKGEAHYFRQDVPALVWDAYAAVYQRLLDICARVAGGTGRAEVAGVLTGARFLWERLLDLPYGSMEIISADEVISAALAAEQLAREHGEPAPAAQSAVTLAAQRAAEFAMSQSMDGPNAVQTEMEETINV